MLNDRRVAAALVVLLALAFALRFPTAAEQSYDNDEILTLRAIQEPTVERMLNAEALTGHPPLYFLLLRPWGEAAGHSEFAIRFVSIFFGLLAVAALVPLLRSQGRGVVLAALGFAAVAPFLIYYAQEARMYALATFAVAVCALAARRFQQQPSLRHALLFGAAAAFCIYSALLAVLPVIGFGLVLLVSFRRQWRAVGLLAVATVLAAVLFLPWALYKPLLADAVTGTTPTASWLDAARLTLVGWVTGESFENAVGSALSLGVLMLVAPAVWVLRRNALASLCLAVLGTSLVLVVLLSLLGFEFAARHVSPVATIAVAWLALAAAALWRLRVWAAVPALLVLALMVFSTGRYFLDPFQQRPQFRQAAVYLGQWMNPGDRILYNAPWAGDPISYYLGGQHPHFGVPPRVDDARGETAAIVDRLTAEPGRLWHVQWQNWVSDPRNVVEGELDRRSARIDEGVFPYVKAAGYYTGSPYVETPPGAPGPLLGDSIRLDASRLDAAPRGGRLSVELWWTALRRPGRDFTVFVQLLDRDNRPVAQSDRQPAGGFAPTSRWLPGQTVWDRHDFLLPTRPAPGEYRLIVGMYDAETGQRLPAATGADFMLLRTLVLP